MHPALRLALIVFFAAMTAIFLTPELERKYGKSSVQKWAIVVAGALGAVMLILAVVLTLSGG